MTTDESRMRRGPLVFGVICAFAANAACAEVVARIMRVADTTVHYKLVLPHGYGPTKEYPAVLVLGGGPQTMDSVDRVLERVFRAEAERRGYLVVAPAAPDGERFFRGADRIFPEFLDRILANHRVADRKFHIAGPSNGGISALHLAAHHPQYFLSATALPGYLWQPSEQKLLALAGICMFLYIGEHDTFPWHSEMERQVEFLKAHGTLARYTVEPGQGHWIDTLAGANASRLFDGFDEARHGCVLSL